MQNVNNCSGQRDVSLFDFQINTLIWIPQLFINEVARWLTYFFKDFFFFFYQDSRCCTSASLIKRCHDLKLTPCREGVRLRWNSWYQSSGGALSAWKQRKQGTMPSPLFFWQLRGKRGAALHISTELKMQSLSQRAWRFVFPHLCLALQHSSFSIFTSEVFLHSALL